MAAPDDPPPWPTAKVVEHVVEHFRWDSEPRTALECFRTSDSISDVVLRGPWSTAGPSSGHDAPSRAAKASSIRSYMRPPTSPSTRLDPNFAPEARAASSIGSTAMNRAATCVPASAARSIASISRTRPSPCPWRSLATAKRPRRTIPLPNFGSPHPYRVGSASLRTPPS